jgi:glucosamine--fructose-6-phosphate aminotransferase (isomerizing)
MQDQKNTMPKWAQELYARHPGVEQITKDTPGPAWREEEVRKKPLWYTIRGGKPRTKPPYLLIEELHKEPDQWQEILDTLPEAVEGLAKRIVAKNIQEVIFTGCGSAFFTAIHGELTFPVLSGIRARAIESFELEQYFPEVDASHTLVIAHSGTGGSIEVRNCMKVARGKGCSTVALVNTKATPLEAICEDALVYPTGQGCGPCINVISTRILVQIMLGIAVGKAKGRKTDYLGKLSQQLPLLPQIGSTFLQQQEASVQKLAEKYKETVSFFLVGSGPHYFSAREGALKIEEESICVNKAHHPGDFHHGIISVLDPKHCTIAISAERDSTNARIVDCLRVSKAAGTATIAVVFRDNDPLITFADDVVRFSGGVDEILTPIPVTLFPQMFGYYRGVARGYNPDTLRTDHWPNAKAWLTAFPPGDH